MCCLLNTIPIHGCESVQKCVALAAKQVMNARKIPKI